MKKIYYFLLLFVAVNIQAQTFSFADHRGQEVSGNMVAINHKVYYVTRIFRIDGCCNDSVFIVGRNEAGAEVLRKFVYTAPFLEQYKILKTNDDRLLVHIKSQFYSCDQESVNSFLMGSDTLGASNWTLQTFQNILDIAPATSGGFHLMTGNSIIQYDAQGNLIANIAHVMGAINSVIEYSAGVYVASAQTTNGPRLYSFNSQAQIFLNAAIPSNLTNLQKSADGGIIGISGTQIAKYSSNFGLLHMSSIPNVTVTCFATRGDSIFIGARGQNTQASYILLDSVFSVQHTSSTNIENIAPRGISISPDNSVNIVCYVYKNSTGYTTLGGPVNLSAESGYFRTKLNGNINGRNDIGVKRVEVISIAANSAFEYPRKAITNAKVVVNNYGTDTVHNFNLNLFLQTGGIQYCQFGLNQNFSALILPGDSVSVLTGPFTSTVWSSSQGNIQLTFTFCIFTSIPNHTNDIDISNDQACLGVSFLPLSLVETHEEKLFQIMPNPANTEINILLKSQFEKKAKYNIELYNVLNQRILIKDLVPNELLKIEISDLSPGLVFVRVLEDQVLLVSKKITIVK